MPILARPSKKKSQLKHTPQKRSRHCTLREEMTKGYRQTRATEQTQAGDKLKENNFVHNARK
jgi:hypothetical protein